MAGTLTAVASVFVGLLQLSYVCLEPTIGLGDVAESVGSLYGSLETCQYQCANGASPKPVPGYDPEPNGCGPKGNQISVSQFPGLTKCCNQHDKCYGSCNDKKKQCDVVFKQCMEKACQQKYNNKAVDPQVKEECLSKASFFFTAVKEFGCRFYKNAQEIACVCCTATAKLIFAGVVVLGCDLFLDAQREACTCTHSQGGRSTHNSHGNQHQHQQRNHDSRKHNHKAKGTLKDVVDFLADMARDEF